MRSYVLDAVEFQVKLWKESSGSLFCLQNTRYITSFLDSAAHDDLDFILIPEGDIRLKIGNQSISKTKILSFKAGK